MLDPAFLLRGGWFKLSDTIKQETQSWVWWSMMGIPALLETAGVWITRSRSAWAGETDLSYRESLRAQE